MSTISTPTIKRILRVTEYDLLRIKVSMGNMYMCQDTMKLYFDQGNSATDRVLYNYISVKTVNDLNGNVSPVLNYTYYCWDDNSLWVWLNRWVCLYSDSSYPSAYAYEDVPSVNNPQNLNSVYRYDMPNMPADDNGLLKDGSVVVRDKNRLIKGKIYVNDDNDNLVVSSYLGGGIRLLPNGKMSTEGELLIGDEGVSTLRSRFKVLNNEMYVDYSEHPEEDNNRYQNNEHLYKVFHEGNIDTSAIQIMTPLQVYNKLLDSSLPNEFAFNVNKFANHTIADFSLNGHTHTSADITDLGQIVDEKCKIGIRKTFNTMSSVGITSSYNATTDHLSLKANDFTLTFKGGATGVGTIQNLTSTQIVLEVNPDEHIHQDLLDEIDRLKSRVTALESQIN